MNASFAWNPFQTIVQFRIYYVHEKVLYVRSYYRKKHWYAWVRTMSPSVVLFGGGGGRVNMEDILRGHNPSSSHSMFYSMELCIHICYSNIQDDKAIWRTFFHLGLGSTKNVSTSLKQTTTKNGYIQYNMLITKGLPCLGSRFFFHTFGKNRSKLRRIVATSLSLLKVHSPRWYVIFPHQWLPANGPINIMIIQHGLCNSYIIMTSTYKAI